MTTLTTGALASEIIENAPLASEDLTRRLTLLALDAVQHPDHAPQMRPVLVKLDVAVMRCGGDEGINVPLFSNPLCLRRLPWQTQVQKRLMLPFA